MPKHIKLALFAGLLTVTPATAQNPGFGVGNIHEGLVVGIGVGVAAAAGIGITFLVLHNRGVVEGCVTESGGKRTLVLPDKRVFTLLDGGPSLPAGDRVKLKGHKSGPASVPSFQADKVLKDYGHCQP